MEGTTLVQSGKIDEIALRKTFTNTQMADKEK
jgi:hypothetical protein